MAGAFWFAGLAASGWMGSIFGVLGSLGAGASASSASSSLLGGQGLLVVRQQTLRPGPLQAEKAVQRAADLALRLAAVAQDQGQAGAGVPVVVEGLGEAGAGLGEAGQELAFEALGAAGAEDAGGDGLGEVAGDGADGPSSARTAAKWAWLASLGLAQGRDGDVGSGAQAVGEAVQEERRLRS